MNPNCKSGMISSSDSIIIILTVTSEFLTYFYNQNHRFTMLPKIFQDFFLSCYRNSEYKNSDYFIFQIRVNQGKPLKSPIIFIRSMRNCGKKSPDTNLSYTDFSAVFFFLLRIHPIKRNNTKSFRNPWKI